MSIESRMDRIEREIGKADEVWWCGLWYDNEEKPEPPPNKKNVIFINIRGLIRPEKREGESANA